MNLTVGQKIKVMAGTMYEGVITEVEKNGFWLTENEETEEFVSYLDVEEYVD